MSLNPTLTGTNEPQGTVPRFSRQVAVGHLKTRSVPGLERGLALLEMLSESSSGLTISQCVRKSGLPKSSVHCLIVTLMRCGYLRHRERSHRFALDMKFLSLADRALAQMELREQATPHLRELARTTQLTAQLAIFEQGESLILSKIVPVGGAAIATWTGKRIQPHCTALGKALIAYMRKDELEELVRERGLVRHSENTITSLNKLLLHLEKVRNQRWALNDEESAMGTRCVAAPVFNHLGRATAAISVSGTIAQITSENYAFLAESAKAAALALSEVPSRRCWSTEA